MPVIHADKEQIIILFQNLITNAIRFRRDEPPRVHISAQKKESWEFMIQDNGLGISSENINRIFMIFQRIQKEIPETPELTHLVEFIKKVSQGKMGRARQPR